MSLLIDDILDLLPASLRFGGVNSDRVDCGSSASLDNLAEFTYAVWVYRTSSADNQHAITKDDASPFGPSLTWSMGPGTSQPRLLMGYSTTSADAQAASGTSQANRWEFVVGTLIANAPRIYLGHLGAVVSEVSYFAQQSGVGTRRDDSAAPLYLGNLFRFASLPFVGRIAWAGVWARGLSLDEIRAQQFRPHVTGGCVLFMPLGHNARGRQIDLSPGRNHGAVTGTTVSERVPLSRRGYNPRRSRLGFVSSVATLSVADAAVALTMDAPALTQANTLSVNAMAIALAHEAPSLTQQNTLAVQDAGVALAVDSPSLTQAHTLAVQDALVALAMESPTLSLSSLLDIAEVRVALGMESPALTQANVLAVQDSLIALAADSPSVVQAHVLAIADALVALSMDSLTGVEFLILGALRQLRPDITVRDLRPGVALRDIRPAVTMSIPEA